MRTLIKQLAAHMFSSRLNELKALSQHHQGESCYIIGDGASLKWFDLANLQSIPCFSLGYINIHNQSDTLDLRYRLITEPFCFFPLVPPAQLADRKIGLNPLASIYKMSCATLSRESYIFAHLSNLLLLNGMTNILYLQDVLPGLDPSFATRCEQASENIFNGSIKTAISLSILMGFRKVFLLGCDYTHKHGRRQHWHEYGPGKVQNTPLYAKTFFDIARDFAEIITITLDGPGECLPHETYREHTNREPVYRENHQLCSFENLLILSKYSTYQTFPATHQNKKTSIG